MLIHVLYFQVSMFKYRVFSISILNLSLLNVLIRTSVLSSSGFKAPEVFKYKIFQNPKTLDCQVKLWLYFNNEYCFGTVL